ncbi:MAG: hypothetical protein OCU12_07140 [Methanophagales archaeon]|nr:hypothetical protein [Methanophagales archaeon]
MGPQTLAETLEVLSPMIAACGWGLAVIVLIAVGAVKLIAGH